MLMSQVDRERRRWKAVISTTERQLPTERMVSPYFHYHAAFPSATPSVAFISFLCPSVAAQVYIPFPPSDAICLSLLFRFYIFLSFATLFLSSLLSSFADMLSACFSLRHALR